MVKYSLKINRGLFIFLVTVINAANALLVPHIPIDYLAGFTAIVLNALIVYLAFEEDLSTRPATSE